MLHIPTPAQLLKKAEATTEDMFNAARKLREGGNDAAANYVLNAVQQQKKVVEALKSACECKRDKK